MTTAPPTSGYIGPVAEKLRELKTRRLELNRQADEITQEIRATEEIIIDYLQEQGMAGAKLPDGTSMSISTKTKPAVDAEQWDDVWRWCVTNNYTQLLYKQLTQAPYRELLEMGVDVHPAITPIEVPALSFTKTGK